MRSFGGLRRLCKKPSEGGLIVRELSVAGGWHWYRCQSAGGSESGAQVEGKRPSARRIEAAHRIQLEDQHASGVDAYPGSDASKEGSRATKTIGHPESSEVCECQPLDRQSAKLWRTRKQTGNRKQYFAIADEHS